MGIRTRDVIILIVVAFICFMIGFYLGGEAAVRGCAKVASHFIDIDEELVRLAINQYQGQITSCYRNLTI